MEEVAEKPETAEVHYHLDLPRRNLRGEQTRKKVDGTNLHQSLRLQHLLIVIRIESMMEAKWVHTKRWSFTLHVISAS